MSDFGKAMKAIRKQQRISLEKLAQESGTSSSTLSRFEKGNNNIKLSTVIQIFDKLGYRLVLKQDPWPKVKDLDPIQDLENFASLLLGNTGYKEKNYLK